MKCPKCNKQMKKSIWRNEIAGSELLIFKCQECNEERWKGSHSSVFNYIMKSC